eukprot:364354-Chlamydomonas_euryale.AAC.3
MRGKKGKGGKLWSATNLRSSCARACQDRCDDMHAIEAAPSIEREHCSWPSPIQTTAALTGLLRVLVRPDMTGFHPMGLHGRPFHDVCWNFQDPWIMQAVSMKATGGRRCCGVVPRPTQWSCA